MLNDPNDFKADEKIVRFTCSMTGGADTYTTGISAEVPWDLATRWDPWNMHDGSSTDVIAPADGLYLVTATVTWVADAVGYRLIQIFVNNIFTGFGTKNSAEGSTNLVSTNVSGIVRALAGQDITIQAQQTSGGDLATSSGRSLISVCYLTGNW